MTIEEKLREKIIDFIRQTIKDEREQAVKEERERLLKALPKEREIWGITSGRTKTKGFNLCLYEVKKLITLNSLPNK